MAARSGSEGIPVVAVPAAGPEHALPPGLSLRAKAIVMFIALGAFILAIFVAVGQQRLQLISLADELEHMHVVESALGRVNAAAASAVLKINDDTAFMSPREVANLVAIEVEGMGPGLRALYEVFPGGEAQARRLEERLQLTRATSSRADMLDLRAEVNALVARLGQVALEVRARKDRLWEGYRAKYDEITLTLFAMAFTGFVTFGAIVMFFFTRLARDIRRLADRAIEVVRGDRGEPVSVTRGDEVGRLMDSVNRMQEILRRREQELEVTRQQRFHQEKMAAVGSLAAAVAHEINNPIAAIQGVAESILGACENESCGNLGKRCHPDMILQHTRRISQITRQLGDLTARRSDAPEWVDVNNLLRSTVNFLSFDRRLRHARIDLQLEPSVPAAWVVPDHVTQIAMNLLLNAADALAELPAGGGTVSIDTGSDGEFVRFSVADNGCGMTPEVLERAFDEAFTTKPAGRGSGIGLFMCKVLIERGGGRIAIDSQPDRGTRVDVDLPIQPPGARP
ncbi:MAG: HAMP domain-containing protein [Betaproteobacteria bacterium]|nr:HAMP domain-containing protein [Betaproteobacteria bacterium]PWB61704.1 MAG: two-component sensor histidine kinase [Betaproteobacteria bacterium]